MLGVRRPRNGNSALSSYKRPRRGRAIDQGDAPRHPGRADAQRSDAVQSFPIDLQNHPDRCFRIDTFVVPDPARAELEATMRRNMAFIRELPGYLGHVAFEKRSGPAGFDLVTVAAWESAAALEQAGVAVRAYYQRLGLDLPAALARWGVTVVRGDFTAPGRLQ
jgi:heme-degrading monooxygenase HmoA